MSITKASDRLPPFTARHEGKVHVAYRDPGGVMTIGIGFTGLSKVFTAYWKAKRGHALKAGDTITNAEIDEVFGQMLATEYVPPVAARFKNAVNLKQAAFDAAVDMTWNCGAGALKWQWADNLDKGYPAVAAKLLKTTAITAKGKTLPGLVTRRSDEAQLILRGYPGDEPAPDAPVLWDRDVIVQVQADLIALKVATAFSAAGEFDDATKVAVSRFQVQNPPLVVDGLPGPATRSAIRRALDARTANAATVAATAVGAGAGTATHAATVGVNFSTLLVGLEWGLPVAAIAVAAGLLYRYHGFIFKQRTAA